MNIFDNPRYQMAQTREMIKRCHAKDMELPFLERLARTERGQEGLLTREEITRLQNHPYWTNGLNHPHP